VLESLARALRLDEAERMHLLNLAESASSSLRLDAKRPARRPARQTGVRQGM
jgi:hypothetical protein